MAAKSGRFGDLVWETVEGAGTDVGCAMGGRKESPVLSSLGAASTVGEYAFGRKIL